MIIAPKMDMVAVLTFVRQMISPRKRHAHIGQYELTEYLHTRQAGLFNSCTLHGRRLNVVWRVRVMQMLSAWRNGDRWLVAVCPIQVMVSQAASRGCLYEPMMGDWASLICCAARNPYGGLDNVG